METRVFIECKSTDAFQVILSPGERHITATVREAVTEQGLDLERIATVCKELPLTHISINSDRPLINWPEAEWTDADWVVVTAPNCPRGVFNPNRVSMKLDVPEIPSLFHLCKELTHLFISVSDTSNLRKTLLAAPRLQYVAVQLQVMPTWWPVELCHYRGCFVSPQGAIAWNRFREFYVLQVLVTQGILSEGSFHDWLTKNLYDPRLLQAIASFIRSKLTLPCCQWSVS